MKASNRARLALFLCVGLIIAALIQTVRVSAQGTSFDEFKKDLDFIRGQVKAALLFNPIGTNPDPQFERHKLTPEQIIQLCGGSKDCGNLGMNFATMFKKGDYNKISQEFGMKWTLEIAAANAPQNVADGINEPTNPTVIVRIGVSGDSIGFKSFAEGGAQDYIAFLKDVSARVNGKTFYAIAGPNEPDIEKWIAPECGSAPGTDTPESKTFYDCIGQPLAKYMNAVCAGGLPGNIKLLSPAFNMTSYTFPGIVKAMDKAGANWSCVDAIAGNLYPAGKSMQAYWTDTSTGEMVNFFKSKGKQIVITETGPIQPLDGGTGTQPPPERKVDDFYLQPIKGLSNPTDVNAIRTDLIKQGYEARCATPGFKIVLSNADLTAVQHYLRPENNPGGAVLGGIGIDGAPDTLDHKGTATPVNNRVKSTLSIDYRDALIPVFRDFTRVPQLKQSLESYFSYGQNNAAKYSDAELKSAPVNSLLTQQERCTQSVISLQQRDIMCKKLQNPSACALYTTQVPNTSYTVKTLLEEYQKLVGISTDTFKNCGEIVRKNSPIKEALLTLPLHIEKSYRLAFLVTTIKTRVPLSSSMLSLFQHPKRGPLDVGPDPAHVVIINAFKVPDFTTNKGTIDGLSDSGDTAFNDPSLLTRDILIPSSLKQEYDKKGSEKRQQLLKVADEQVAGKPQNESSMEIMCEISGVGGPQCFDPVTRAVVDLINAQSIVDSEALECGDAEFEEPQVIFDAADIHPLNNAGRIFNADFGVSLLENLFTDPTHKRPLNLEYDPTYADTNNKKTAAEQWDWGLKSVFYVVPETASLPYSSSDARQVKHFIVYPEGYDLKTIEAVVSGSFFSTQQLKALQEKAKKYEYLRIKDDSVTFNGGSTSLTYLDKSEPCGYEDEYDAFGNVIGKRPKYCERTIAFGIRNEPDPRHAGILGGKLGYWLYTMQMALNKAQALTHKYLESCTKIEDFLLDQCGGATVQQTAAQTPLFTCSAFPSTNNLSSTNATNFEVKQAGGSSLTTNDFIAVGEEKGCAVKTDTRVIDSLTLILSDGKKLVGNNPGNKLSGCGDPANVANSVVIYKWTGAGKPGVNDAQWNNMPKLVSKGSRTSRLLSSLKLKTGYYKLKIELANTICAASPEVLSQPNQFTSDSGFILDFTESSCRDACFTTTIQPAMQGGNQEDYEKTDEINECKLDFEYAIWPYNNACGGGRGGDCSDESFNGKQGCQLWKDYISELKSKHATGVSAYEKTFSKSLEAPSGNFTCTHTSYGRSPLFPSTSIKSDCSQFASGTSAIDSIALFGVDLSFSIPYWNGAETPFTVPSQELWSAITDASKKHGCDPWLVLAVAHSESRSYTNHTVPNGAGALGVFQFTPGPWGIWSSANATGVNICAIHQPPTFSTAGLDFSSPTNIPAAADSACRLILWTGMQRYQTQQERFVRAFSSQGDNSYGQIWNAHQPQADYVWRLWNKLLETTKQSAQPQPVGYPYGPCPPK